MGSTVYILIEFQSTVERFMIVRALLYVCMLYQDLLCQGPDRFRKLVCCRGLPIGPWYHWAGASGPGRLTFLDSFQPLAGHRVPSRG